MNILFLNQIPEVNNKYSFSLCKAISELNYNIILYSIKTDDMSKCPVKYINEFGNYSIVKSKIKKVTIYFKSWIKIIKYCEKENISIVHVQWYIFSPLDYLFQKLLKKRKIKVIATIHDLIPFDAKIFDNFFIQKIYQQADHLVVQCDDAMKSLQSDYKIGKDKISLIPHGHYMDYQEMADYRESLKYLNLEKNKKIILFFGQIKKVKGLDILIKAMKKVVAENDNTVLVIAGKVWKDNFNTYQKLIENLNLKNNVKTYIRFIDDEEIKYFFTVADIVVLPYLESYQSGVVHLAYAYEKPVIASNIGEFKKVIQNRETGELVEVNNTQQLSEIIIKLLDSPELCEKYGKLGKKYIKQKFSWDKIGEKLLEIYKNTYEKGIK